MIVAPETFYNILLTPKDLSALKSDIRKMMQDEIDWTKYPSIDKLTDALWNCNVTGEVVS